MDRGQRHREATRASRLYADAERPRRDRVRPHGRPVIADEYYIVTGTGFATHDFDWISRSIPEGLDAQLIDVTSSYAVLSVMGPKSRDVFPAIDRA